MYRISPVLMDGYIYKTLTSRIFCSKGLASDRQQKGDSQRSFYTDSEKDSRVL
jgi:hypothetical protein